MRRTRAAWVGVCLVWGATFLRASDWPQFRGPAGTGAVAKADFPLEWSEKKNLAWKTELPGPGWSQPVVVGGRVFLTAAVSDKPLEPKGFLKGVLDPASRPGGKAKAPDVTIQWQVLCLDAKTGKPQWTKTVVKGKPKYPIHPSNTYATESPAADADRVYTYFGATGTVAAHDHSGKEQWKTELGAYPTNTGLGTGSSLALAADKLFVQCFNEEKSFFVCLDAKTGKEKWRAQRDKAGTAWSTPLVWKNKSRTEVLSFGRRLVISHDPDTGKELWRLGGVESPLAPSATADGDRLYFGGSAPGNAGAIHAVKAGASGDITAKDGEAPSKFVAWSETGAGPGMASPVVLDGLLFVVNQGGLACYDAKTGERKYRQRVPKLRTVAASPVAAGGQMVLLDESGEAIVVKAGPKYERGGGGKLDDLFWATPALAGGSLYMRGVKYLYCIRK